MSLRWRGPAEGWWSLALLVLLAFLVGFAVHDARWVLGRDHLTEFLPFTAVLGTLAGFVTAELGWGRLRAHLATAVAAALIVPVLVGSAIAPEGLDVFGLFHETADASVQAFTDLVVHGSGSTTQYGHYMLVLGLLIWGTAHFASYAVYRHHRPFSAVIALGLALVVNMSLTPRDQLAVLVLFSVGALLLLVDLHAFDERRDWLRRRIGDPAPLAALTFRGGMTFVLAAVLGSLVLTTMASSAPLRDAWIGAEPTMVEVGRNLQRLFPFLATPRGPAGISFDTTAEIGTTWTTNQDVAATVTRPAGDDTGYYWRAATYDRFEGFAWTATAETVVPKAAQQDLLAGSAEAQYVGTAGHREVTVKVQQGGYTGKQILSPTTPVSIDVPTKVSLIGPGGFVAAVSTSGGVRSYSVTAMYPTFGDVDPKGITANKLRVAGTDYPSTMAPYLVTSQLGPASQALLEEVRSALPAKATDPYDWAKTMETYLRDPSHFHYSTDVSGLDCGNVSAVECFARYKQGFCMYYASTMAILLRTEGIPTRLVEGFLPGEQNGVNETIRNSLSHAWVEVWFPGYGWVDFDPTGGGLPQLGTIPAGRAVPTPSPSPSAVPTAGSSGDRGDQPQRPDRPSTGGGAGSGSGDLGSAPYIAIAVLLLGAMGLFAYASYRRGPREVTADGAWRSVTRLARRLGAGPRPTQTVYEYTAALGDLLPTVRPELETVARAKVEVAYGGHALGEDRLRALRAATGRLRIGLLRLAFRRRRRPR